MGGLVAFPMVGIYNASKVAMEAVTEVLAQEVKDFGIKVTAIEPGMFKTDWIGRSLRRVEPAPQPRITRSILRRLASQVLG
jgi:NAD(P)-dependent dehydrogenase (short-subunit alcohol dehydrogenase family)